MVTIVVEAHRGTLTWGNRRQATTASNLENWILFFAFVLLLLFALWLAG